MLSISRSDLADMYGITRKTLYNWLKKAKIEIRQGCAICWKEQQIIFDMFGAPEVYKQKQKEKADKRQLEKEKAERQNAIKSQNLDNYLCCYPLL